MADIVETGLVQMPDRVVRQADDREAHTSRHLTESFRLGVLLETESREVHTVTEDESLGQNTDTTNTVNLHLHVRVAVGVAQVGKMGPPRGVLGVALDNDGVFIQCIGKSQGRLRLLPRVEIVRLLAAQPVGQRAPDVGHNDVLVVTHQILQNGKGGGLDVDVTPVDPRVVGAERGTEEPVAGLGHELTAAGLSSETVATLDVLVDLLAKVLFEDRNLAKVLGGVGVGLDGLEVLDEHVEGVVLGVGDQKGEVDEVVWVGKVAEVGEEHGQMGLGVAQGHTEKDALLALPAARGALDVRQVIVADCLEVDAVAGREEVQGEEGQDGGGGPDEDAEEDNGGDNGEPTKQLPSPAKRGGRIAWLKSDGRGRGVDVSRRTG